MDPLIKSWLVRKVLGSKLQSVRLSGDTKRASQVRQVTLAAAPATNDAKAPEAAASGAFCVAVKSSRRHCRGASGLRSLCWPRGRRGRKNQLRPAPFRRRAFSRRFGSILGSRWAPQRRRFFGGGVERFVKMRLSLGSDARPRRRVRSIGAQSADRGSRSPPGRVTLHSARIGGGLQAIGVARRGDESTFRPIGADLDQVAAAAQFLDRR